MRALFTGLRGVGKSTVGKLAADTIGFCLRSLSDLLRGEFPGFTGSSLSLRRMLEALPLQERVGVYQNVIHKINATDRFILEMPVVESGEFDLMVPLEPVARLANFSTFIFLEADPTCIREWRRGRIPKGQDPRFIEETEERIGFHQAVAREMLISLGMTLGRPVFIVRNVDGPHKAAQAVAEAIKAAEDDTAFFAHVSERAS